MKGGIGERSTGEFNLDGGFEEWGKENYKGA